MPVSLSSSAASNISDVVTQLGTITFDGVIGSWGFNNIPQTYQDLMIVYNFTAFGEGYLYGYFNGFSVGSYSAISLNGNGSTVSSSRANGIGVFSASISGFSGNSIHPMSAISHIINYKNTNGFKTIMTRTAENKVASGQIGFIASTWNQTVAINAINGGTFAANTSYGPGSTITLYGIRAGS
jgi:hypothetical protein